MSHVTMGHVTMSHATVYTQLTSDIFPAIYSGHACLLSA